LRFSIGNNDNGTPNTATVSLGSVFSEDFTRQGQPPFETIIRSITITTATTGRLVFDQAGGDNAGIVIDNVRLAKVPEPSTFAMIALGFAGVVSMARRRKMAGGPSC
jgi:hypothetical protein